MSLRTLAKAWNDLWFSRTDPLNLSAFRICSGLLLCAMFAANFFNWERFYAIDGMMSLHDLDIPGRLAQSPWSIFYWTDGYVPIAVFWYVGFAAAVAFTVGYRTRVATITLYVLVASMVHRNHLIVNGDDLVLRMVLFYSCFIPLNRCLSVDTYLKDGSFGLAEIPDARKPHVWAVRLMQINVALIYVISVPDKLATDVAWVNGQAIYYTVTSNMWSMVPFPELFYRWSLAPIKVATYGTLLIEASFPVLVWFKETALIVIVLIASLHIAIAFTVPHVTFFTLAMACSFFVFVPSEVLRNVGRKMGLSVR